MEQATQQMRDVVQGAMDEVREAAESEGAVPFEMIKGVHTMDCKCVACQFDRLGPGPHRVAVGQGSYGPLKETDPVTLALTKGREPTKQPPTAWPFMFGNVPVWPHLWYGFCDSGGTYGGFESAGLAWRRLNLISGEEPASMAFYAPELLGSVAVCVCTGAQWVAEMRKRGILDELGTWSRL